MTKLELFDKKNQLEQRMLQLVEGAEKEERKLSEEENNKFNELKEEKNKVEVELKKLEDENNKIVKKEERTMGFKLIKAIADVANNRQMDERSLEVVNEGAKEMRKAGLSFGGQIQLPIEQRAGEIVAGTATNGQEVVAEDKMQILEPLRNALVMTQAGATWMTNLVGDVSIPAYTGTSCGWKGEVDAADNGAGTFSEVTLSPKRLTSFIDVSKEFLLQDSASAEEMLRRDIVNSIAEKLEETILGDEAGSNTKPEGLFNGAGAGNISFSDLLDMEVALEEAKINGEKTFIVNPKIKKALKTTSIGGTKSDVRMLMDGGDVDGVKVLSTNAAKGIVLGSFREYVIAQWGALDLTVDPYTVATNGAVRIVINAYFDAKPRRKNAFVAKTIA